MPKPIKNVNYKDLMRIKDALGKMEVSDSFYVRPDLQLAVRRIANDHYPEIKISVRKIGDSYRAFRVA